MPVRDCTFVAQRIAEQMPGRPSAALISITNPGEVANLQPGWGALLRVAFADVEYDHDMIQREGKWWPYNSNGFPDRGHAETIRAFVADLPLSIAEIMVHCGAGVSRSAGVAKWIAGVHQLEFDPAYNSYNKTVYALLQNPTLFDHTIAIATRKPAGPQTWWKSLFSLF